MKRNKTGILKSFYGNFTPVKIIITLYPLKKKHIKTKNTSVHKLKNIISPSPIYGNLV